jgi:hypothetical protein
MKYLKIAILLFVLVMQLTTFAAAENSSLEALYKETITANQKLNPSIESQKAKIKESVMKLGKLVTSENLKPEDSKWIDDTYLYLSMMTGVILKDNKMSIFCMEKALSIKDIKVELWSRKQEWFTFLQKKFDLQFNSKISEKEKIIGMLKMDLAGSYFYLMAKSKDNKSKKKYRDISRKIYQEIIKKYPGTKASDISKAFLKNLDKQK